MLKGIPSLLWKQNINTGNNESVFILELEETLNDFVQFLIIQENLEAPKPNDMLKVRIIAVYHLNCPAYFS